jgi:NADPH-dependent glutamate synthase beta subunit-like oxidoreductase
MQLTMDGQCITAREGMTVLEAAREAGIYIPALCSHPDLTLSSRSQTWSAVYRGPTRLENPTGVLTQDFHLCLVEINGELRHACGTLISEGMKIETDTLRVREARRSHLKEILADHPHACLICPLASGCDRLSCTMNVPVEERCCSLFGRCELQKISEYVGIPPETPRYTHKNLSAIKNEPLFEIDYNLCLNCLRCVSACNDLRGVGALGFVVREGRAFFGTVGPTLIESGCKFCGACVAVCPTGALMDKGAKKLEDKDSLVPCRAGCPAGIDIPRYVRLIAEGKHSEALAVVRERVPFPGVLSYVCYHPCETVCRRGELNQPISICRLKRFAVEQGEHNVGAKHSFAQCFAPTLTGKRVAVVGSGPAGLTAAYYLARKGHAVTVFETLAKAGGMMRYGIPPYRLPRKVLDAEITEIKATGVEMCTSTKVSSVEELFGEGFHAIYLAAGAMQPRKLKIPGEDLSIDGLTFLRRVNANEPISVGARVAVIGGGNVAIDCARTALRRGAERVMMLYRRSCSEMPAYPEEIDEALNEGVQLECLVMPQRIALNSRGSSRTAPDLQLECVRTQSNSRQTEPTVVPESEFFVGCDTVIVAIGQEPESAVRAAIEQKQAGLFAGGDLVSGPSSVIEAIAMGRQAATEIDRYLGGNGDITESFAEEDRPSHQLGREIGYAQNRRQETALVPVARRLSDFGLTGRGFSEEAALAEARRCLRCDLRLQIACVPFPPNRAVMPFTEDAIGKVPACAGVFQLFDQDHEVFQIKGAPNLQLALRAELSAEKARYFSYEPAELYTSRESELLQEFLQRHGKLPKGNDELEDLF